MGWDGLADDSLVPQRHPSLRIATHLVVWRSDHHIDAGENGRAVVAPIDDVFHLHDGHHPGDGVPEDALPVGVVAPGRGQLEVPADVQRLRPAGHRGGHWPQIDAPVPAAAAHGPTAAASSRSSNNATGGSLRAGAISQHPAGTAQYVPPPLTAEHTATGRCRAQPIKECAWRQGD
jgi:hypothetical protein